MLVGFIGLGIMGGSAAGKLVEAGHEVYGFDIDEKNLSAVRKNGVKTIFGMEKFDFCRIVFLSLPGPREVKPVVTSALKLLSKGTILIDLSTVDPGTSREMNAVSAAAGIEYLDSPILGTPQAVGDWILPIGGAEEAYEKCRDILSCIAGKTFYLGKSGSGSALKLLNNLMVGAMANGIAEAMALSNIVGLSPKILMEVIGSSKAPTNNGMFHTRGKRMVDNNFEPDFKLDLLAKDVDLGNKMARSHGVHLVTCGTVDMVQKLAQRKGLGSKDFSALYLFYQQLFSEA